MSSVRYGVAQPLRSGQVQPQPLATNFRAPSNQCFLTSRLPTFGSTARSLPPEIIVRFYSSFLLRTYICVPSRSQAMAFNSWDKLAKAQRDYPNPKYAWAVADKALKKQPSNPYLIVNPDDREFLLATLIYGVDMASRSLPPTKCRSIESPHGKHGASSSAIHSGYSTTCLHVSDLYRSTAKRREETHSKHHRHCRARHLAIRCEEHAAQT
jgi:hypothetical protein